MIRTQFFLVAVKTHVAAPASTNSQGLRAKPVREELPVICACTGPVGAGLGSVYVECGGQTWAEKMLTYTNIHTNTHKHRKSFKAPYPRMRSDMIFSLEKQERLSAARFARLTVNIEKRQL